MDFNDSKDEAAFRAEAAAWLKDNVPSKDELAGLDELAAAKLWQKRKYDAGWACIRWDKEFGGRGASAIEQVIWNQEEAKYNVPAGFFVIGDAAAFGFIRVPEGRQRQGFDPAGLQVPLPLRGL